MSAKKTVLFDSCRALNARFIDFAGWRLPFSFTSPGDEHLRARAAGALFDVSHMGEIRIRGRDSLKLLQKLLPTDIGGLKEGGAQYSALLNPEGGLIDDLIAYCLQSGTDYLLCVNAGPKDRVFSWIKACGAGRAEGAGGGGAFEAAVTDESELWAVIAVQGPKALSLCEGVSGLSFSNLKKFCFLEKSGVLFSRTGYTGEDGIEIYVPTRRAALAWRRLTEEGKKVGIAPAGLGARDTLRLEAGYLLSGQDFDEKRGLKGAGLLRLKKNPEFYIGKEAVPAKDAEGEILRAFVLNGRGGGAGGAPSSAEDAGAAGAGAGAGAGADAGVSEGAKLGRGEAGAPSSADAGAGGAHAERRPPGTDAGAGAKASGGAAEAGVQTRAAVSAAGFRGGVPRSGNIVFSESGEEPVGVITSGAKSPSLNQMIGLAYIKGNHAPAEAAPRAKDRSESGSANVLIEIHNQKHPAVLVKPPFIKKKIIKKKKNL